MRKGRRRAVAGAVLALANGSFPVGGRSSLRARGQNQ